MRIKFSPVFKKFAGWLAIVSLILAQATPGYALRPPAPAQTAGAEELAGRLRSASNRSTSGLEESLTWMGQVNAHDPVKEITEAIRTSDFITSVQAVNRNEGETAWRRADQVRPLEKSEIKRLQKQGSFSEDWSRVRILIDMQPSQLNETLARIRNVTFEQDVEIGRISAGEVTLRSGAIIPKGIRNVTLRAVRLGNDVAIDGQGKLIQRYVIKDGATVRGSSLIGTKPGMNFGISSAIEVANEAGKRKIAVFPEISLKSVTRLTRDRSDAVQSAYKAAHAKYTAAAKSGWGIVEEGVQVEEASIRDSYLGTQVYVSPGAAINESILVGGLSSAERKELDALIADTTGKVTPVLLSGLSADRIQALRTGGASALAEFTAEESVFVQDQVLISHAIIQPGAHIKHSGTLVRYSMVMEHAEVDEGAKLLAVVLGPDGFAGKSELGSIATEMAFVTHHQPSSILALTARHGVNIGSGTKIANHKGYGPFTEVIFGPGLFMGTDSVVQGNANLEGAAHSLISTRTLIVNEQSIEMPFSLVRSIWGKELAALSTGFINFAEIQPGWTLEKMPFLLFRNEWKWAVRQKAIRTRQDFRILQPETVRLMQTAFERLSTVPAGMGYYMGDQSRASRDYVYVEGLGKNLLREQKRKAATDAYEKYIRYYALEMLFNRLSRLNSQNEPKPTADFLQQQTDDAEWEYALGIINDDRYVSAAQRADLPGLIETYLSQRLEINQQVTGDYQGQLDEFAALYGPDAAELLGGPDKEKFLVSFGKGTDQINTRAAELTTWVSAGQEETLSQAVPLAQVPVTYPASGAPDFTIGGTRFVFVSLVAGDATRWQTSIASAQRESEFSVVDPATGQQVIRSKVLTPLTSVPGFPADQGVPVGWLPISAALSMGGKAIAIVGSQKELVVNQFSQLDEQGQLSFAEQTVRDGTGGAFWRASAVGNLRQAGDLPVVVGAGDQPLFDATFFEQILGALTPGVDLVVGTATVAPVDAQGKGRIVRNRATGAILGILEQKDITAIKTGTAKIPQVYQDAGWTSGEELDAINEINTGVYSIRAGTMDAALSNIRPNNAQGQFYATDMVSELLKQGKTVASVDVPAWRMPDVTTINDLPGVVSALAEHQRDLRFTAAGAEEGVSLPTVRATRSTSVTVPAAIRQIITSQGGQPADEIRQEMGIYGSVFVDPTGLAVGVSLQTARLSDGSLAPQRFVVANEAQEAVLLKVLAPQRQGDIVRAWQHGGVQGAIEYANKQLSADGLIAQTIRPQNVAAILPELRELMQLLAVTNYDAEFAAGVAREVYTLFA